MKKLIKKTLRLKLMQKIKIFDDLKDGIDFIDKIPSTPAMIIGVIIGSLIPFKLILIGVVLLILWAGFKYVDL